MDRWTIDTTLDQAAAQLGKLRATSMKAAIEAARCNYDGPMTSFANDPRDAFRLQGALNFRDLGGFQTRIGRRTRSGRVFRSNSLQELTPDDLEVVQKRLQLKTIIDLRAPAEIALDGLGPLAGGAVKYINLPLLLDDSYEPTGYNRLAMVERYLAYLDVGAANVVKAIEIVADPATHPVVFHCAAGKDRTGVLAALLLCALDVDSDHIIEDYAASQRHRKAIVQFLTRRPSYDGVIERLPPSVLNANPETMRSFLAAMEERYGGAVVWLRSVGLNDDILTELHHALLEETQADRHALSAGRSLLDH